MSNYIHGSNGLGEAVLAHISEDRNIGDMQFITDTVLNWPTKFIATAATLGTDGYLTDQTIFFGYLAGGIIYIDHFAPGYTDNGNLTDQVIVIKPTTAWADQVADYIDASSTSDHAALTNLDYASAGHTGFQPAGAYLTEETDPVFTAWDKDHADLTNIGTNTHAQLDTKVASLLYDRETMKDPTGFTNNDAITVNYDSTTRKITLTGTFAAYYRGELVTALTNGWVSAAHPTTLDKTYFLRYDGANFVFDDQPWTFDQLQIAYVQYYTNDKIGLKETHGFMDWHAHQEFHQTIGAYRTGGGTLTALSYALNSTTAADRRPLIDATTIYDEDLKHVINALTTETYTQKYLTGSTGARVLISGATDIIPVTGATPYYNQYTGGAWQQTAMQNNEYAAIWLTAIPVTSDAGSQVYRYIWTQPQSVGTLPTIQALTTNDINIGEAALLVSEFVFLAKVIIQMTGNNWQLISVTNLTGNRFNQTGSPTGNYLSTVAHDTTLTGDGTVTTPLAVANPVTPQATGFTISAGTTPKTLTVADTASVTGTNTGDNPGVTSVSGTAPVVSSGGNTPAISMAAATSSVNGYMTSTYAGKLDGIAAGAEVNVQADWTQATNTADDYIKNKPTLGTAAAKNIPAAGNASATEVVYGSDTRLSDARAPLAHNQAESTITFTDITTNNASTSSHGFLPKLPAPTGLFLKDDGTWAAPTGAGDMILASVQSVTGLKTFDKDKIAMKGTSTGKTVISTANTSATDYTATLPASNGTIAITSDITAAINAAFLALLPVNSTWYGGTNSANPSTYLPGHSGSTWVADATGRVIVGKAASGTFDTAGATGGAETVTLTAAQSGLVGHNHTQNAHSHAINESTYTGGGNTVAVGQNGAPQFPGNSNTQPATATNNAVAAADAASSRNN